MYSAIPMKPLKKVNVLYVLGCLVLFCAPVFPEETPLTARFFVSPSGDDLNDGLSWATAKATPQAAADVALGMSTYEILSRFEVWLHEGVYRHPHADAMKSAFIVDMNEGVNIRFYGGFSGTEQYAEERSWTAHPVIFDGEGVYSGVSMVRPETLPPDTDRKHLRSFNGEEVIFDGIQFAQTPTGVNAEGVLFFKFNHCIFENCQHAFLGNSGESIWCTMGNTLIAHCGAGIVIGGLHGYISLQNCTIVHVNSAYSFQVGPGDYILADNTIFWDCTPLNCWQVVFRNSCYPESLLTGPYPYPEYVDIADCIHEEPGFVDADAGNYQLRPDSPCVNTGTVPSLALSDDLLGVARPQGGIYDMGTYEYLAGCEATGCHSADLNRDGAIQLGEVLRIIQFYNSRGFQCADPPESTEDGYAPGPGEHHACESHSSDYNPQDWAINLSELLRVIQLYNLSAYYSCTGSEDGFCV